MAALINKHAIIGLGLILTMAFTLQAQDSAGEDVVQMEAFNVTAYHGKIAIIDGFTGKEYRGENDVVFNFAQSLNKLLLGYHKKLVIDEVKHLEFRIKLGQEFERQMGALTTAFGFSKFTLDNSIWLRRERAIISRLFKEPFFKVKSLVAWDLERLSKIAPNKPESKYARDIRFTPETGKWERRITDRWDVVFFNNPNKRGSAFATDKTQGLNLDTQKGFHFIERGLPANVPSYAFKEVSLTYPIFYSDNQVGEKELRYLQETFVANLYFIYDPFSWMARRDTRFRGGFSQNCLDHIKDQRIYVDDRDWFDVVLSRFLSDVVTIKLQGAEEIYSLHMLSKRLSECPRALGLGLDLLNWNKGEKREAIDKQESEPRISPTSPGGFRYVMIDAYQRLGEPLIEKISGRLLAQKEMRRTINGQVMLTQVIEELSGMPYDEFVRRAQVAQEAHLAQHKRRRPISQPPATPNPGQN
jgi:hypothetical protein